MFKSNYLKKGQIQQGLILRIAFLVSLLISVPRILSFYDITDQPTASLLESSYADIIVRFAAIFLFSWVSLLFNTFWRDYIEINTKGLRLLFVVFSNGLITYLGATLLIWVYPIIVGAKIGDFEVYLFYVIYLMVSIILFFISGVIKYQVIHQQDIIEKEQLRQESLENELTALKNQINPHFLFNSLNSLNSLVRENDAAVEFVNKLSFMYRYILQSGDRNIVSLKEELKFLESYVFLIKTRYRERVLIDISIDDELLMKSVPPLGIQTLVENAVKHNEISENNPLEVKVYSEGQKICVENPIRMRKTMAEGTGNGLANLDKRYFLLNKEHISISDKDGVFKVKFPLI